MKAVVIMYISSDLRAPRHKRASTKNKHTKLNITTTTKHLHLRCRELYKMGKVVRVKSHQENCSEIETLRNDTEGTSMRSQQYHCLNDVSDQ